MYFYSNPFDDFKITGLPQQDLIFNMECEAFEYTDSEAKNAKMIGLHYYLNENITLRGAGMANILDEELKDLLVINRTELDNQQFKITFD